MKDKILISVIVLLLTAVGVEGYYLHKKNIQNSNNNSYYKPVSQSNNLMKNNINEQIFKNLNINPFKEFQKMQEQIDKTFGSFNAKFQNDPNFNKFFKNFSIVPKIDVANEGDKYIISAEIPGSKKNSIKVKIKNHILTIDAKTEDFESSKKSNFIQKERYIGNFERSIMLPSDIDENSLKTKYVNGILTITLSKK